MGFTGPDDIEGDQFFSLLLIIILFGLPLRLSLFRYSRVVLPPPAHSPSPTGLSVLDGVKVTDKGIFSLLQNNTAMVPGNGG